MTGRNPGRARINRASPGMRRSSSQNGQGQGIIVFNSNPYAFAAPASLATFPPYSAHPATAGDLLTIYCTGLGPVQGNVAAGAAVSGQK